MNSNSPITQEQKPWHALPLADVVKSLDSREQGLTQNEVAARLEKYGRNLLPQKAAATWWQIFFEQFRSPLIYILGAAAIVSLFMGDFKDAGFIAGVLLVNALIGTWQEWKAEQSSQALKKLLQIRASVLRDGEIRELDADQVVPGDVVSLESGNRVPADIRLLTANGLESDESLLTGESLPVTKDANWAGEENAPVGDRLNMVFAGSIITHGRARGVVVATGTATGVGQLALDVLQDSGGKPPLLIRMEEFTKMIAIAVLGTCVVIGILGTTLGGYSVFDMFMFGVALAVSAIPEGLPVAMTVALSIATTRMAKRGLIVRRLTAVEGLGSCTLIATDKTGTLTCNELTVREIRLPDDQVYSATGEGFNPQGEVQSNGKAVTADENEKLHALARAGVLCNEADLHQRDGGWVTRGDAVDVALLAFGHKLGLVSAPMLEQCPQVNQIPFEPEHQFSASFHRVNEQIMTFVKGAPERVLAMCADASGGAADFKRFEATTLDMAKRGYRVLALAEGVVTTPLTSHDVAPTPAGLTFLGFVGMIDPLRPGVKAAVKACGEAGVAVSMVTGDHRATALAIARDLGMADSDDQVMTGTEMASVPPEKLGEVVERIRVFARVAPRQKLQIVEAARKSGHAVAVTGDGVNDAPALRAANIGVAMGKSGTDVAREASELVLSDDNFTTIINGVEEGRVAYDNIRKVIYMSISTGAAELGLMTLAVATGTPYLPLLPVQLLWLNVVTNGIQDVALAFEPNEGDVLKHPPRSPQEPIFNRLMIERTLLAAAVMTIIGFVMFRAFLPANAGETQVAFARNALLLYMVLVQNIHIGNCRSETKSALLLSPFRSPILLAGVLGAFLLHVVMMYLPFGRSLLDTEPVSPQNWLVIFLLALAIFPVMEIHKLLWKRRFPDTRH